MLGWATIDDGKVKGRLMALGMFGQWQKDGHTMVVVSRLVLGQGAEYYIGQSLLGGI
jgi:hypothetical protein